ncbi:MAG: DNA/RNA nuclease SfsA [Lysobacterales bacterium]
MEFSPPLQSAQLIRRYKRFLADVKWPDGTETTVHCPNTGAMTGCADPGARIWLSRASNPKRKYPWTWELVETAEGVTVGIHTGRTNRLAEEAILAGQFASLDCATLRREVTFGDSRLDFVLTGNDGIDTQVEVKNVTAAVSDRVAAFPDTVSVRATKHVQHLTHAATSGRAALVFVVQRGDVDAVRPAQDIDPAFAQAVSEACEAGVQVLAARWSLTPQAVAFEKPLPVLI